ncbi:MAG: sodium-dependent transporter, partial [Sphaerochaetaceae bacterium]
IVATLLGLGICAIGLQKGVEKITKYMMSALLLVMILLVIKAVTLPGAGEGLKFYLLPDFKRLAESGVWSSIYAAMGQAFFTLSLGIGSMAIFGSYIGKDRSLTGESINVIILDTFVALMSGLIIFPAAFAFGVQPDAGPSLIFITLPNIFNSMAGGRLWGSLFFVFMIFAALSTLVAVFENIISYWIDTHGWSRKKAVLVNIVAIIVLSVPCVLGFNLWSNFQPLGAGTNVLDLEDFIVSNHLLPLGSLVFLLFATQKRGWGWSNFLKEADTGTGIKFPKWSRIYVTYILPLLVIFVFIMGYIDFFS